MRETSLDEFVDRDGGGGDGSSEGDGSESEDGRESEPAAASGPDSEPEQDAGSEPGAEPELESGPEPEPDSGSEPELDRELDAVEPAVSTYDWTPIGADCEACGTAVERRWRDDGRLVCADCKAW